MEKSEDRKMKIPPVNCASEVPPVNSANHRATTGEETQLKSTTALVSQSADTYFLATSDGLPAGAVGGTAEVAIGLDCREQEQTVVEEGEVCRAVGGPPEATTRQFARQAR